MDLVSSDSDVFAQNDQPFHFAVTDSYDGDESPEDSISSLMLMVENMESLLPPDFSTQGNLQMSDALFAPKSEFNFTQNDSLLQSDRASTDCTETSQCSEAVRLSPDNRVLDSSSCSEATIQVPTMPQRVNSSPHTPIAPPKPTQDLFHFREESQRPPPLIVTSPATQYSSSPMKTPMSSAPIGIPAVLSPCSVRDIGISSPVSPASSISYERRHKPVQKAVRKPKTYAKPVASRFCHICSRMPRRGQGSAVCCRMREGLCRKIVCEQCIREQGWNYEQIRENEATWQCPHCANICPQRSQCHIYNRINARRKKVQPQPEEQISVQREMFSPQTTLFNSYSTLPNDSIQGGNVNTTASFIWSQL